MNKRFLTALLTGAFFIASASMFVACKDYDDDINHLQAQIDSNAQAIKDIQTLIQNGSVIKSVDPITNGVKVTLSDGKTFEITNGKDGANGANGADGKDGIVWTIGTDGFWYKDGVKTDFYALGKDGKDGKDGVDGKDGKDGKDGVDGKDGKDGKDGVNADGSSKYYVPNATTGTFWVYNDGDKEPYDSGISFIVTPDEPGATITAVKTGDYLYLFGVPGGEGDKLMVTISLNGTLKALVFVPQLYLDGIESIQYPWIGGQILEKNSIKTNWEDLSHHGTDAHEMQDIQDPLWDYIPNTLGRYYDIAAKQIKVGFGYAQKQKALTAANEWIYGPAWAVQYHLNPSNTVVDYTKNAPQYNVLEPDVIYYNTRASETALGVTSPKDFYFLKLPKSTWRYGVWALNVKDSYSYGVQGLFSQTDGTLDAAKEGILTAGIQIAHPDKLAPWGTDDTINPNGYPASATAPANETYPGGRENNWYGLSWYKYDPNNKDNTVALQLTNDEGSLITSDYALLVPTRVQLEGLIWAKKPNYSEPAMPGYPELGPNRPDNTLADRDGDEEGWKDANRIHVWDSPEEALNDPAGAALELYVGDVIDLKEWLGVHYIYENKFKKEQAVGVNNTFENVFDLGSWKYGEEAAFGLHYEYQFVDYENSTNKTHDSRYAAFDDWDGTWASWQATNTIDGNNCNKTGVIKVKSVNAAGETQDIESTTSVDREPLVRVMLKNAQGKILLDGYILLHINYLPDNTEIPYPAQNKEFDLCNRITMSSNWSEFSNILLQNGLNNAQLLAFNDYYWADCKTGGTIFGDDGKYVTPDAKRVINDADGHAQYQLRLFNFGDLYGNNISAAAKAAMKNGGAADYEENSLPGFQSNQGLGVVYYKPNGEGTTNHVFHWSLSPEEIEYITHDLNESDYPVTVSRWFRYVAKDEHRMREVNNYSAPYPYIWVKMTMVITRKNNAVSYKVKDTNYWYHWKTGADNIGQTADAAQNWSALVWDIQAPRDNYYINTFDRQITNSFVGNVLNITNYKYYFAPKPETVTFYRYTRTSDPQTLVSEAINTTAYVQAGTPIVPKTVQSVVEDFDQLPADLQSKLLASGTVKKVTYTITPKPNGIGWDQLYCKYVYPHAYANMTNFDPSTVNVIKAQDAHPWVENKLKENMQNCAIDYTRGAFANDKLYAIDETGVATQIATLNQTTGEIELLKNDVTKLVLNAVGYKAKHANIYEELRTWVGVVKDNGCGVAMYTYPEKTNKGMADESYDLNTFLISWQRPINTNAEKIVPALDANTNENYINLIDYLKFFDWRGDKTNQGYMYDGHYWFWSYYRMKAIALDMDPRYVYTNLHFGAQTYNKLSEISGYVDLYAYSTAFAGNWNAGLSIYNFDDARIFGAPYFNEAAKESAIENFMGNPNLASPSTKKPTAKQRYGTIYYQNNGHNVDIFNVYIPYTVEYEWGWITRFANWEIDSTHGVH